MYALCLPTKDIDFDNGTKENNFFFTLTSVDIYFILGLFKVLCAFKHTKLKKSKSNFSKDNHRQVQYACLFFYGTIKSFFIIPHQSLKMWLGC